MRKNAKESVNCNAVNPECDIQVEGNPTFFQREMVNVPLWNDCRERGKNRLMRFADLPCARDSAAPASSPDENEPQQYCLLVSPFARRYDAPSMKSHGRPVVKRRRPPSRRARWHRS